MKRRMIVFACVVLLAGLTTGCIKARPGARCRTTDWGDSGTHVLRCVNGRWQVAMTRQQAIDALVSLARRPPEVGSVVGPASLGQPDIANLADPSVLVDGSTTYVYGTTNYRHVPVVTLSNPDATAADFAASDAMPTTPSWASSPEIWAPAVHRFGQLFVMYFAAHRAGAPDANSDQCVGRSVATSPVGPFVPDGAPAVCGTAGALDPSIFVGPDGAATLLVAMGGSATNIFSIPLGADGGITGAATPILTRAQPWQDWFLENPAMIWDGSTYLLAYSAGHWDSADYMTGIARCASPAGPCTDRADGPWLASIGDRVGPGGLEFFVGPDGAARVAFHTYPRGNLARSGARATHIARFFTDPWPRLG